MEKVRIALRRSPIALVLALLSAIAFFNAGYTETAGPDALARHMTLSAVMFLLSFGGLYLLSSSVLKHLARERSNLSGDAPVNRLLLWAFVLYKECIKTVIGVSLTLGWMAGLLFISEHWSDQVILVPLLLGLALSALAFLPALFISSLLDHIRYPQRN